jgi:putative transposase
MRGLKVYSSRACNKLLNRTGVFWQAESYDHWARDEDELVRMIAYVEQNPVKAGLVKTAEEWKWSSARVRIELGLRIGEIIPKPVLVGTGSQPVRPGPVGRRE